MLINREKAEEGGPWEAVGTLTSPLNITLNPWPKEVQERIVFDFFHPLGMGFSERFVMGGRVFWSLNQYTAFSMARAYRFPKEADEVLRDGKNYTKMERLRLEKKLRAASRVSSFDREEELRQALRARLEQSDEVRKTLIQAKRERKTLVYADSTDLYYSCGEETSTAELVLSKHFSGLNMLGKMWMELF